MFQKDLNRHSGKKNTQQENLNKKVVKEEKEGIKEEFMCLSCRVIKKRKKCRAVRVSVCYNDAKRSASPDCCYPEEKRRDQGSSAKLFFFSTFLCYANGTREDPAATWPVLSARLRKTQRKQPSAS